MDNFIYTNSISAGSSMNYFYFVAGVLILSFIIWLIVFNGVGLYFTLLIGVILMLIGTMLSSEYSKDVQYNKEIETKQVQLLPYEHVNTKDDVFIFNEKKLQTLITNDTKYIKDSSSKPYIIVEKVTYAATYKWYIKKEDTKRINDTVKYVLKEFHY